MIQTHVSVVGTCSICRGAVVQEDIMYTSDPPQFPNPYCRDCGATKKKPNYGPVIDMEPCQPPAHPYPVPFEKFQPGDLPYYVEKTLTPEPPCNPVYPTLGGSGRAGVELFPFEKLPPLGSIIEAIQNQRKARALQARTEPKNPSPRMGNHGFFLVNGEDFLQDEAENKPTHDKYPFHGDLI